MKNERGYDIVLHWGATRTPEIIEAIERLDILLMHTLGDMSYDIADVESGSAPSEDLTPRRARFAELQAMRKTLAGYKDSFEQGK